MRATPPPRSAVPDDRPPLRLADGDAPVTVTPTGAPPGGLWDVPRLAAFLNVSSEAVRGMMKRGEVPPTCIVRIGRRVRFVPARVCTWLGLAEGDLSAAAPRGPRPNESAQCP